MNTQINGTIAKEYLIKVDNAAGEYFAVRIVNDKPVLEGNLPIREAAEILRQCVTNKGE